MEANSISSASTSNYVIPTVERRRFDFINLTTSNDCFQPIGQKDMLQCSDLFEPKFRQIKGCNFGAVNSEQNTKSFYKKYPRRSEASYMAFFYLAMYFILFSFN